MSSLLETCCSVTPRTSFGSFYTTKFNTTVLPKNPILFPSSTVYIGNAFTWHPGSGDFFFHQSGNYKISFGVSFSTHTTLAFCALALKDSKNSSPIIIPGTQMSLPLVNDLVSASVIVKIKKGQILQLINASCDQQNLGLGGTFQCLDDSTAGPGNCAYLTIESVSC